jgi:molybdate transport system substrate-binding protein
VRTIGRLTPVLVVALVLSALDPTTAGAAASAPSKPSGEITVSAAASLTEAFTQIGAQFERKYRDVDVSFNFDASSALVLQIQQGAPVDVFASADEANMDRLVDGGQVTAKPVVFARNELAIATKPGNPEKIVTLADLADVPGVVALCAAAVPCGKYADAALEAAGVTIPPEKITRGLNAKATLTSVSAGDADAAIVYVTDVNAAGSSVRGVAIPDADNQVAVYPIAPVADAANVATAKAFTKYVSSPAGQRVLKRYGFLGA